MHPPPAPLLDDDLCAFVASGVSIGVSTRDAALRPHAVRAVGGRHEDGRLVLFVPRAQARAVLDDVAANGRVAVVFSKPSTHRTVQLKAGGARVVPLRQGDRERALAYRDALQAELGGIGYTPAFVAALLAGLDDELVGIELVPESAFLATPGPGAGTPLEPGRGG